jgi:hypothetical protein
VEIKTVYKVISAESVEIERELNAFSRDGWRPITMSCRLNVLTVILENKVMGEATLNLSSELGEGKQRESTMEEVQ